MIFNAPTPQIYNGTPLKKYTKNCRERILFSCKTRIVVPKRESLLWTCSFVISSFDIDEAKMVTTRSQIAERRAKLPTHKCTAEEEGEDDEEEEDEEDCNRKEDRKEDGQQGQQDR
jgi:hypothetical protein